MSTEHNTTNRHLKAIDDALGSGALGQVRHLLNRMPAPDVAHLLETSPPRERRILWQLIDPEHDADILQYLGEEVRGEFLRDLSADKLLALVDDLEFDDLADLLQELPEQVTRQVLAALDEQNRERLERVLSYPEDTAGGLMNTDVIAVRPDITLGVVQRYLRLRSDIPDTTDSLAVTNRRGEFVGLLPLSRILVLDARTTVREAMLTDIEPIPASLPDTEVARIFERRDLVSAPVVDDDGILLGRITIDDVVDVILEDADHSIMSMGRLDEAEDTFGSVWHTLRHRSVWLGVNLITAFTAASVISLFQDTIDRVVALAVLMPIVASMGGVAGSQTLTLVIRAMALGQVKPDNSRYLIFKELGVGLLNGLLWATMVGTTAMLWLDDVRIGLIIGAAMVINLLVAAGAGASVPMLLRRAGIDPALAGGVALTTITDVVGFFSFLGLATLLYTTLG